MENDDDDVIYLSSDSDDTVMIMKRDVNSNPMNNDSSASTKNFYILFKEYDSLMNDIDFEEEEDDDIDSVSSEKCGSEYSDVDSNDDEEMFTDRDATFSTYERGPVSIDDVIEAMEWAEARSSEIEKLLYSRIESFLKNKTVIQIQVYGTGLLDLSDKEAGPLQLAVAFNLVNRFKEKYPDISITCQEPEYVEEEKEYLRSKGVKVLETEEFSSEHFIEASKAASNIPDSAFICYMIHGMVHMYEEFVQAHWEPDILSRCIFVGNDPKNFMGSSNGSKDTIKFKKFAKLCKTKRLNFEGGSLANKSFGYSNVYSISKENAKALINRFP